MAQAAIRQTWNCLRAEMRSMGEAVLARVGGRIWLRCMMSPSCGDYSGIEALCRSMRENAPEQGSALQSLLDPLFDEWIPRSFGTPTPGYLAYIPGGGIYTAALGGLHRRHDEPLHRHLAGRTGPRAAGSQCAGLVARLDAVPADRARPVHHRWLDGDVQRHRLRARKAAGRRHPRRRPVCLLAVASLHCQGREACRHRPRPRARHRCGRRFPPARGRA